MNPKTTFEQRRRTYLEAIASEARPPAAARGEVAHLIPREVFHLIPRLEIGNGDIEDDQIQAALDWIAARRDCADFALAGLLRILYRYGNEGGLLSPAHRESIERAVLNFCYWYDQKSADGRGIRGMCFHTENHQILFHNCEALAGQRFPDRVFTGSGQTGRWHVEHGTKRALQWTEQRARFGFAEWLSCYFEETLLGLLNLYDFVQDETTRRRAGMLIDILLFEVALHSHQGVMGTTHGRTYAEFVKGGRRDPTTAIAWLVFGQGEFPGSATIGLSALATSGYRCPAIIERIAGEIPDTPLLCHERHGVNVEDAPRYGVHPDRLEDAMFFWACQTARHPHARETARQVAQIAEDPWLSGFIEGVDGPLPACRALVEEGGAVFDGDAVNTALSEANIVTYRTREYLLSCAQDFRPGRPGYQQHIWQATLSADAVVFTNHPGSENEESAHTERPNFWAGNRWLPRAAQYRNVVICIHHVPAADRLPFSHAYFPRRAFDEVRAGANGWTFGRKGDGYIALYSQHPIWWDEDTPSDRADSELRPLDAATTVARDHIWICEMGSREQWGSFERFTEAIAAAPVRCEGLGVAYESPSVGQMRFGWTGPLLVQGNEEPLRNYPRFDNPYCRIELGEQRYTIRHHGDELSLDFTR